MHNETSKPDSHLRSHKVDLCAHTETVHIWSNSHLRLKKKKKHFDLKLKQQDQGRHEIDGYFHVQGAEFLHRDSHVSQHPPPSDITSKKCGREMSHLQYEGCELWTLTALLMRQRFLRRTPANGPSNKAKQCVSYQMAMQVTGLSSYSVLG